MKLKKITLKDRNLLQKFFKTVKEPLADTTFTMRYIWAEPMKHTWAIINRNLCFFGFLKGKYVLWGPPLGSNKLNDTIDRCFDIVKELNDEQGISASPIAIYITEEFKSKYEAIADNNNCEFGCWAQDYIYSTKDIAELKGKNYKSKRNALNIFARNKNISVEEFEHEKHLTGCLSLIDLWKQRKEDAVNYADKNALDFETAAARNLIKYSKELGVKGLVLKANGKLIGISLGEKLNGEMCSNIIEKTNIGFKGASEFIFREFAKYWHLSKFLNAQDDFGVDYLRKIKLSYRPVKLLKSYCLKRDE